MKDILSIFFLLENDIKRYVTLYKEKLNIPFFLTLDFIVLNSPIVFEIFLINSNWLSIVLLN